MAKRKSFKDLQELPDAPGSSKSHNDDADSDEDMDMVNVDFEWFDPQPAIDFHGLKTLLRQLFDVDNQLFDLSELADLILSQPLLGSTVKVDGNETDPYAFLTVLNLHTHKDKKVIQSLTSYLSRIFSNSLPSLSPLLSSSNAQIGLILTERFINMPHEIVPPMYTMLVEEITWALQEAEPYAFTHYLVLSKCYTEVASTLTSEAPPSKKKKGVKQRAEVFHFHAEDEVLARFAMGSATFEYENVADEGLSDSKRAFQEMGVRPMGWLGVIEREKFAEAVEGVKGFLGGGQ